VSLVADPWITGPRPPLGANAEVAIIPVDARQGVLPQTRAETRLAHERGIRHVYVVVNGMDLVGNEYVVFKSIQDDFLSFAESLGFDDLRFFPISAPRGVERGTDIDWYEGPSLREALDSVGAGLVQ